VYRVDLPNDDLLNYRYELNTSHQNLILTIIAISFSF
jgi:hypothetical protein